MKVVTIVGARPQFVKAAVVSRAFKGLSSVEEILIHTGQHFDQNMSDIFFDEMDIPKPKFNLDINSMSHGKMTGRMMEGIEEILITEKPDALLVYGDTNSTLAGALVASKLHIPIGHVEAGLRSFNMRMPEEKNRILTDRISKWLFCPTEQAVSNLLDEGYEKFDSEISLTGDVMYDAALFYEQQLSHKTTNLKLPDDEFVLVTLHREENTSKPEKLSAYISMLNALHARKRVVMVLHPGTKKRVASYGLDIQFDSIAPVGYFDMIRLLKACSFVMTDSGGLQKEAFFFKKYCITLREQTEWVELLDHQVNFLCGPEMNQLNSILDDISKKDFPVDLQLYGNGTAGQQIVKLLQSGLNT